MNRSLPLISPSLQSMHLRVVMKNLISIEEMKRRRGNSRYAMCEGKKIKLENLILKNQ